MGWTFLAYADTYVNNMVQIRSGQEKTMNHFNESYQWFIRENIWATSLHCFVVNLQGRASVFIIIMRRL